ncbi:hypothetical protein C6499_20490 [Candidatus Poribacteria bacterium]|nr:MAG: hypothetical protein C6499_20490 [Candidatus Poribacteria bacterium]
MRTLCVFSILAILSIAFFASAELPVKNNSDPPFSASCLAQRHGLVVEGKARVEATKRGVDAFYHIGYTQLNPWKALGSTSNPGMPIDGDFSVPYRYPRANMNKPSKLYVTASIWGLNTKGEGKQAAVSDTSN